MDRYVGQVLKNWAGQKQPPGNLRARLLLMATVHAYQPEEPFVDYLSEQRFLRRSLETVIRPAPEQIRNFDLVWVYQLPLPGLRMI
jgi:hypothetical protein